MHITSKACLLPLTDTITGRVHKLSCLLVFEVVLRVMIQAARNTAGSVSLRPEEPDGKHSERIMLTSCGH